MSDLPVGSCRGLPTPTRARYRRYDEEAARERLTPYEAGIRVADLLHKGYGLTLMDVRKATGCRSLDTAHNLLQAATRHLHVQVESLPTDGPPGPGKPRLVWYLVSPRSTSEPSPSSTTDNLQRSRPIGRA